MSLQENTLLLERAADLIDEFQSHPAGLDDQIVEAVESGDLERLRATVSLAEATLAQEHFGYEGQVSYDR